MTTIAWYIHHHGHGHRTRFLAVRPHLDVDVVAVSTLPPPTVLPARTEWVVLPRDDDGGGDIRDPTAGGMLHWAPLGHPGHRSRLAAIARLATERQIAGIVVDTSAEVTLFARILGVPVVVTALPGDRTDEPHRLAFRAAARVVAAWSRGTLPDVAGAPADRVTYVGGISRFDGRARDGDPERGTVYVLGDTAADVGPSWRVSTPKWTDDPWAALCRAEVVVSAAGQNAIADLAAAGARAVVVPQVRPFDEQATTGRTLARLGLAVVTGRADGAAAAAARDLEPHWTVWRIRGAAARMASAITEAFA